MDKKILIADDEPSIRNALAYALKREGFLVETAVDGEDALEKVRLFHPDVLILDVMMPKLGGYEVCRRLESRKGIGILLLTAKNDIVDKVLGLELGADDFMSKPFDLRELLARIKALVRRLEREGAPVPEGTEVVLGPLRVRPSSRIAELGAIALDLTPKEFDVLALLVSHAGRVYTRDELLEQVWSFDYVGGTRTVDIHIQRLRKKLEPHQAILQTVYGIGYKAEKIT
ncbi:response regulator transcription factor [Paenibacillus polymyxa]|uniref:response regulator transcription factor n=1 Tax=Paenibacillus polymyxa TaxID=1406 RepID=UPI0032AFA64E